jgi:1-deoxy-D-xylulose-5-phosphate reductoisomerase
MGRKITVDSATMMNKGLEVIEARYLFGLGPNKIKTVIHKESIIHSIVGFKDGSYKAQLSIPDMKLPIAYALFYPQRSPDVIKPLDFGKIGSLSFKETDLAKYPCLRLAYESLEYKNSMRVVLNAANEGCVEAFLDGKIRFLDIPRHIERIMSSHNDVTINSYEDLLSLNDEIRTGVRTTTGGQ